MASDGRIKRRLIGVAAGVVMAWGAPGSLHAGDPALGPARDTKAAVPVKNAVRPSVGAHSKGDKPLACHELVNVWQRSLGRESQELCAKLDRSRANLIHRPDIALALAKQVLMARPKEQQALLLVAHANFQLGKAREAYQQFLALSALPGENAERPVAVLHLWARARAATQLGAYEQARAWYRHVLLSLEALPDSTEQACALLEAAWVSIYAGENYQEAHGYLRRALQEDAAIWGEVARGALLVVEKLLGQSSKTASPQLYARLVWLLEQESQAKRRRLLLPPLGQEFLLSQLAFLSDRPRAEQHLLVIVCEGGLPTHLDARLSDGPRPSCPKEEPLDDEWSGPGAGQ